VRSRTLPEQWLLLELPCFPIFLLRWHKSCLVFKTGYLSCTQWTLFFSLCHSGSLGLSSGKSFLTIVVPGSIHTSGCLRVVELVLLYVVFALCYPLMAPACPPLLVISVQIFPNANNPFVCRPVLNFWELFAQIPGTFAFRLTLRLTSPQGSGEISVNLSPFPDLAVLLIKHFCDIRPVLPRG